MPTRHPSCHLAIFIAAMLGGAMATPLSAAAYELPFVRPPETARPPAESAWAVRGNDIDFAARSAARDEANRILADHDASFEDDPNADHSDESERRRDEDRFSLLYCMELEQGVHTGKYLDAAVGQTYFNEYSTPSSVDPGDSVVDAALGFAMVHWAKTLRPSLGSLNWDAGDVYLPLSPDTDDHPWLDFGFHHSYDTRAGSTSIRGSMQLTISFASPLVRIAGTLLRLSGSCAIRNVTVSSNVGPDQAMSIVTFSFG